MTITQSSSAPLVVIGGATGNQGGSVLHWLQESDQEYRLRALTRDSTKPKAKALADLGVDVVSIDLKPENKDKIQEVYTGADVVFVSASLSIWCSWLTVRVAGCYQLLGTHRHGKGEQEEPVLIKVHSSSVQFC
jgi:nucleoside-diphosphate-sugar epimerase